MNTAIQSLELLEPRSLREALRMMRDEGPLLPIAGCTDVYVSMNFGTFRATRLINLWYLDDLRGIARDGSMLRIGALTTYSELIRSPLVCRRLPMLVAASREVGGVQIQNRGTIGGNIANASPAGDTLPVLAVCDATIILQRAGGTRLVPFADFYTGYRKTVMTSGELIAAIEIPPVEGRQWFRKVGTRAAQSISKVVMAGVRSAEPRLALGSVAPTVIRASKTEAAMASGAPLLVAQQVLADEIQPIDDMRSTAAYRRRVSANLLARFWADTA